MDEIDQVFESAKYFLREACRQRGYVGRVILDYGIKAITSDQEMERVQHGKAIASFCCII